MNKTVDINLANILFHIDEKAYLKLQRYLEAIKRSFAGTPGSDEIIADIEARIAELFQEKLENERQVISLREVDEVITIMGQPEDYMVDEDIFEDAPKSEPTPRSTVKKLYRDIDNKYIGGVCAGLEHYLGFDALWIRLLFVFFALFTGFGFIAYILLWILVPEAATTSQKLDMTGEPVNISNIERKVKEGIDDVAERVKNVDYQKVGDKVKSSGRTFFDALGDIIMFLFKVVGKFIGILLILIGVLVLIALFIGLFTVGFLDIIHIPGVDFYDLVNSTDAPVWLVSMLVFFAVGIPFFFLLYLGLKILVNNLKSIGNIAKFSLLGLWLLSLITLAVLGLKQASAQAYTGSTTQEALLDVPGGPDTLLIRMKASDFYEQQETVGYNGMTMVSDEQDNRLLLANKVLLDIIKSEDSLAHLRIRRDANGSSFADARQRAAGIDFSYALNGKTLLLDDHLTTAMENKFRDQQVKVNLSVPPGTVLRFDASARGHLGRGTRYDEDVYRYDLVNYLWTMQDDGKIRCLDCPEEAYEKTENSQNRVIINDKGVDINLQENGESFKMQIDENGVQIKAGDQP